MNFHGHPQNLGKIEFLATTLPRFLMLKRKTPAKKKPPKAPHLLFHIIAATPTQHHFACLFLPFLGSEEGSAVFAFLWEDSKWPKNRRKRPQNAFRPQNVKVSILKFKSLAQRGGYKHPNPLLPRLSHRFF